MEDGTATARSSAAAATRSGLDEVHRACRTWAQARVLTLRNRRYRDRPLREAVEVDLHVHARRPEGWTRLFDRAAGAVGRRSARSTAATSTGCVRRRGVAGR